MVSTLAAPLHIDTANPVHSVTTPFCSMMFA